MGTLQGLVTRSASLDVRRNTVLINCFVSFFRLLGILAYHNDDTGGGTIDPNSGGKRQQAALLLMNDRHCEPATTNTKNSSLHDLIPAAAAGWIPTSTTGLPGPWAEWQEKSVWRDTCGNVQRVSAERSMEHRTCFANLDLVEFIGASHMNYMAFCAMDEVMHYLGMSKANAQYTMLPHGLQKEAKSLLQLNARGTNHFFAGEHAKNKSHFESVRHCGDRPHDCLSVTSQCDCFFEVSPQKDAVKMRACSYKTSSLGTASAVLQMLLLNLPPHVTAKKPLTEKHVIVIMAGHWDSAAQRDPQAYLKGELPQFFDVVKLLRSDERTARVRLVLSTGPAIAGSSTGWRNNHALAAANVYVRQATKARSDLKIEIPFPSYFEVTLPRLADTADGLHFVTEGLKSTKRGIPPPKRHPTTDGSGDFRYCAGDVGEAYLRMLLDHICTPPIFKS